MKAGYHEETFSLRFTQLAEDEVRRLCEAFPLADIEVRPRKDNEQMDCRCRLTFWKS